MRFDHANGESYEDAGGGRVIHSAPGFPGFPPRLAVELFERARLLTGRERVGLWDPMCGAGGIPTAVAMLRPERVQRVLASDVDPAAVTLAAKNLALATPAGLAERRRELTARGADADRLAAIDRLLDVPGRSSALRTDAVEADVTDAGSLARLDLDGIHVALCDLPYGTQTSWSAATSAGPPAAAALETLGAVLPTGAVIVFVTTERDDLRPLPNATRSFKHGHRHVRMYRLGEAAGGAD